MNSTQQQTFTRDDVIDLVRQDEAKRSITVSVASETHTVERPFVIGGEYRVLPELLTMSEAAVDLERYSMGAPLLFNHDRDQHIGVIERAYFVGKRLYADIRFSDSALGREKFNDVQKGILHGVSPGYTYAAEDVELDTDAGREVARVKRWTPLELSLVTVAADHTVGVGRSLNLTNRDNIMSNKPIELPSGQKDDPAAAERARIKALRENHRIANEHLSNIASEADLERAINDGTDPNDYVRGLFHRYSIAAPECRDPGSYQAQSFSVTGTKSHTFDLSRALGDMVSGQGATGIDREQLSEFARQFGKEPSASSLVVPHDYFQRRTHMHTDFSTGGALVTTQHGAHVDRLEDRPVVEQAGATVISGVESGFALPRTTSSTSVQTVGEGQAPTASNMSFDTIKFSPHGISVSSVYTKEAMIMSGGQIEGLIRRDQLSQMNLELDRQCLIGTGTDGEVKGIFNLDTTDSGINTVTFGGAPTWDKVVEFETGLHTDNADVSTMRWVLPSSVLGKWKSTQKISGEASFLLEADMRANGYEALRTNQISGTHANKALFGCFSECVIVKYGGLEFTIDPYTLSHEGKVRLTMLMLFDVAVRHPESFCVSTDAANQT